MAFSTIHAKAQISYSSARPHSLEGLELASVRGMGQKGVPIYYGGESTGSGDLVSKSPNKSTGVSVGGDTLKANFYAMAAEPAIPLEQADCYADDLSVVHYQGRQALLITKGRTMFDFNLSLPRMIYYSNGRIYLRGGYYVFRNHTYLPPGTEVLWVPCYDFQNEWKDHLKDIGIFLYPVASFTYSPENPRFGDQITFDASSSYDTDGTVISYQWYFGDGTFGEGKVITHAYSKPGRIYFVTLTVTDSDGLANPFEKGIYVEIPEVSISFQDKDNPSREVRGAVADGTSEVKISISIANLPKDVTVREVQIGVYPEDGHLENDAVIRNGVFTQTYRVPGCFVREGYPEDLEQGRREIGLKIR